MTGARGADLKNADKLFEALATHSPDIIYILDPEGRFVFVGGAVTALTGFQPDELSGRDFQTLVWPEDRDKAWRRFNERRSGNRATKCLELRLKTKKEAPKPYDIRAVEVQLTAFGFYDRPVSDQDKNFLGTYGLARDMFEQKQVEAALKEKEKELELKAKSLAETNVALKVLLQHRNEEKKAVQENLLATVKKLVMPYVENLKNSGLGPEQSTWVDIIESNLTEIISPFASTITSRDLGLTPREIEVAGLVREGKTTGEIAQLLRVSSSAVAVHRMNLRAKLGLKHKKINLQVFLQQFGANKTQR